MTELAVGPAPRPHRDSRDYAVHLGYTHQFMPRAWHRLTPPQRQAVVDRLVAIAVRLHTRPPTHWDDAIRLQHAALRLRATVLGVSLDEAGFWERKQ